MSDAELAAIVRTNSHLQAPHYCVAAAEELLKRRSTRRSFAEWAKYRGFEPAAHHRLIISEIEPFLESDEEVLLQQPPGSAKSTYVSVLVPSRDLQTEASISGAEPPVVDSYLGQILLPAAGARHFFC